MHYKTFSKSFEYKFKERKSLFVCRGENVVSENCALECLNIFRKKYFDSKRVVYSYSILDGTVRFNSDGEPRGTAGEQVLNVINNESLKNVIIMVARYFGGILLGASRLAKTYNEASKNVVEGCGIRILSLCVLFVINVKYSFLDNFLNLVSKFGAKIICSDYGENVVFKCACLKEKFSEFCGSYCDIFFEKMEFDLVGENYF
ncbi:MAG: YigZ family protein [Candidatus Improbicoccus pseudotrichonymphae]|uniref:YigZ family protein n=1 Tax=Candidatus Improbicoccus pseudotrichonymphae TaxID=3033792 RepID=A0AA48KYW0_9FIRM|nr:MAG: YigZ family protein [Candidatus Improbicoccus pseudotrichonymphae]